MGDMADYLIDQGMDAWMNGDEMDIDSTDGHSIKRESVTCRYCGVKGLHWVETEKGWRLAGANEEIHSCDQYVTMPTNRDKK